MKVTIRIHIEINTLYNHPKNILKVHLNMKNPIEGKKIRIMQNQSYMSQVTVMIWIVSNHT